jgi:hypothetical protein
MRLAARSLACVLAVLLALLVNSEPPPARAQSYDGKYTGSMSCATIPGQTRAPLQTSFTMVVAASRAQYEREVMRPEDTKTKLGVTERGTGTVSPSGDVSVTGSAGRADWSYEATYQGRFESNSIRLSGAQLWRLPGRSPHERPCTITLSRSE